MRTMQETSLPNLMRHIYPTYRVPRVSFAEGAIAVAVPQEVWCIDTTLSQGVLALAQPSPDQAGELTDLLNRLDNQSNLLRKVEVRVEGPVGRDCLELLLERYQHREQRLQPVAAIPTVPEALISVKGLGLREAGLTVGASDYQLADLGPRNDQVIGLLGVIDGCLEEQIQPRVDLLDVTRADLEAVVFPLIEICLNHLAKRGASELRLRLCDSLGLGLPWTEAPAPRSVSRLVHIIRHTMGLRPTQLEFIGANDLGLALPNAIAAMSAGCSAIACSVGGIGERGGLAPTEMVLLHISGLFGAGCDLTHVPLLHGMLQPLGLSLGDHHPLWGEESLTTSHLPRPQPPDELIAPMDTDRLLGRPVRIEVRPQSGAAGVAHLIRQHLPEAEVEPGDEPVRQIHGWIGERGLREISWDTIEPKVREFLPELFRDGEPEQEREPG